MEHDEKLKIVEELGRDMCDKMLINLIIEDDIDANPEFIRVFQVSRAKAETLLRKEMIKIAMQTHDNRAKLKAIDRISAKVLDRPEYGELSSKRPIKERLDATFDAFDQGRISPESLKTITEALRVQADVICKVDEQSELKTMLNTCVDKLNKLEAK